MNVLIYAKWFFPVPGGTQTVVRDLATGIGRRRFVRDNHLIRVVVVTETIAGAGEIDSYPFEVVRCPRLFRLLSLIRRADVVHLAGPAFLPLIAALALRKPIVVEHHGFQTVCPNGLLFFEPARSECPGHFMAKRYRECFRCNRVSAGSMRSALLLLLTPVRRWLSNRVCANITPTRWLANILKLRRSVPIPHGVAEAAEASTGASASSFAFQGRLVTSKGIEVLLSAVRILNAEGLQFCLKIIGDGPELAVLKSRMAELGGRVRFLGHIPEQELSGALSDVGTVIMPSLGGEVFGLVAAENMARGKLLIASRVGALQEVVGETGFMFETGNAEELASRMREALENPARTRRLSETARKRAVDVFSQSAMIDRHVALYTEILNGNSEFQLLADSSQDFICPNS